ncbi:hypothetical protein GALMADRAFT_145919 [Galerina marginata CBS 339.88]|uniref:Uncharacterized protein n=1 Tax=Galerina marginata (strain CBS 339.88) TaxID=685588 RepID=A0A067SFX9_GALM3|nr:hypothetical protein GALMADRAFT_145919 [Galerina marginata CBS 339.88]
MVGLDEKESLVLGAILESIFYGAYCILFAQYLNLRAKSGGTKLVFLDVLRSDAPNASSIDFGTTVALSALYSCIDFISQGVLIYRCWVVWGGNPFLIIIPSILAFTSFTIAITLVGEIISVGNGEGGLPPWFTPLGTTSFSVSLSVNTIITGLLILKLVDVHRRLGKGHDHSGSGGLKLVQLISFLIESGMLSFVTQLIWVVLFSLEDKNFGSDAIGGVTTLACGIAPTAVIVRVSMGRSYETRLTNVSASALNFSAPMSVHAASVTATSGGQEQKDYKTSNGAAEFDLHVLENGRYEY